RAALSEALKLQLNSARLGCAPGGSRIEFSVSADASGVSHDFGNRIATVLLFSVPKTLHALWERVRLDLPQLNLA
ncbi:hypothetical protein NVR12_08540, partial [Staphylococcus pseudintermedius]